MKSGYVRDQIVFTKGPLPKNSARFILFALLGEDGSSFFSGTALLTVLFSGWMITAGCSSDWGMTVFSCIVKKN